MKRAEALLLIHWDVDELEYRWPAMRDMSGRLLEPFTSYLESLVRAQRKLLTDPKAVRSKLEHATYAVAALAEYLIRKERKLYRVTDEWLEELRNVMLDDTRANPISRGSSHGTKRTTNLKMVNIYRFLYWAQQNRRLPKDTLGWNKYRVRSSLPEADSRAAKVDFRRERLYPLCYPRVGGSTRRDEGQYWATADDLEKIEDFFWNTHTFAMAVRNTLALRIQEFTAWRNESVNSLTVDQFSPAALARKRTKAFCLISPPKQKRGYDKDFAVDWLLIDRIVEYINGERKQLLKQSGVDESVTGGRLFIGINGRPLEDDSYGDIFTTAFKAIGAPKGAGGHSIRRYRTVEEVKSQISRQKAAGLPVDRETIVRAVMDLLGHNAEESGRAYDRVMEVVTFESREAELWRRVQAAELQRDAMRAKIGRIVEGLPADVAAAISESLLREVGGQTGPTHGDVATTA